ncbi:HEAT repeat domain-containing protein [Micromonospora sp. SH-82]|uniref:HEAT repeat domain-containing protein n=1 Tax=Micromonospora sp. SH-82 TaxID=3132938 RepID=UPI003EC1225A
MARDVARCLGTDARERYWRSVNTDEPAVGAIAGLAETGSAADAPLLPRLLGHERPRVRAQAVQSLRLRGAVVAGELVTLVRDPSPTVVRPVAGVLPPALPWECSGTAGWSCVGLATGSCPAVVALICGRL